MNVKENAIKGVVFNIQRFSIHDGPGIRTTVFLKGCPLRCLWCQNPESQKKESEILLFKDKCTLCGQCMDVCPICATSLSPEGTVIDRDICIGCGKCVEICPNEARQISGEYMTVDEVRKRSALYPLICTLTTSWWKSNTNAWIRPVNTFQSRLMIIYKG